MPKRAPTFGEGKVRDLRNNLGWQSGPAYICPICSDPFNSEPRSWQHLQSSHPDKLHNSGTYQKDEAELRAEWRQKAAVKAKRRSSQSRQGTKNERDGLYTDRESEKASESPSRPLTAPENEGDNAQAELALSTRDSLHGHMNPSSMSKKRGAGQDSALEDPKFSPVGEDRPMNKARHEKSLSDQQTQGASTRLTPPQQSVDSRAASASSSKAQTPSGGARGKGSQSNRFASSRKIDSLPEGMPGTRPKLKPRSSKRVLVSPSRLDSSTVDVSLDEADEPQPDTSMLPQPKTRAISLEQLVVEVKAMYAALVMVESKCIEVDDQHSPVQGKARQRLTNDQWRSLIALHRQLLHEHHDFFLASNHPSASENLSKLAAKYSMPARMWRHGIHGFLEVLRSQLPDSFEHMLAFIYIAYSMMALLYETVPSFEDTWIECLGDLARYRMAIEHAQPRDREIWSGVARYWYSRASDSAPSVGRLYHHLAILAKPLSTEQLSLYLRSLTCQVTFENAKGSVMTLLSPVLRGEKYTFEKTPEFDRLAIYIQGILFSLPARSTAEGTEARKNYAQARAELRENINGHFLSMISDDRNQSNPYTYRTRKTFAYFASAAISGMFEPGASSEKGSGLLLRRAFEEMNLRDAEREALKIAANSEKASERGSGQPAAGNVPDESSPRPLYLSHDPTASEKSVSAEATGLAADVAFPMLEYAVHDQHWNFQGDRPWQQDRWKHFMPMIHIMLTFVRYALMTDDVFTEQLVGKHTPWDSLCNFLNRLNRQPGGDYERADKEAFPLPDGAKQHPLWEDYMLRGLMYTTLYFPTNFFTNAALDHDERQLELLSMDMHRAERVLWLGYRIASSRKFMYFDTQSQLFMNVSQPKHNSSGTMTNRLSGTVTDKKQSPVDSLAGDGNTPLPDGVSASMIPDMGSDPVGSSATQSTARENSTLTPQANSPRASPSTPELEPVAHEHEDDVPMQDISPTRAEPPARETSTSP